MIWGGSIFSLARSRGVDYPCQSSLLFGVNSALGLASSELIAGRVFVLPSDLGGWLVQYTVWKWKRELYITGIK